MLNIEFFHDVICSFCFPMSDRMHKINAKYTHLNIQHRSFALAWDVETFEQGFESHEAVKPEVMNHWEAANQNDDDHRFNIDGMKEADFLFPHSKPGLLAAKAAGLIGGDEMYWEVFDRLQAGLFMESQNVADQAVIDRLVKETSVDFDAWKEQVTKPETEQAVMEDLALVQAYGVQGAPALVINQKYAISGAQPQAVIEEALEKVAAEEGIDIKKPEKPTLQMMGDMNGNACRIVDGKMVCD